MAEQSKFIKYIEKYFKGVVVSVTKTLNGEEKKPLYLYKQALVPKQSVDGKWTSIFAMFRNVMADLVAMDSPLPEKSRPSMGTVTGDIPKIGMEKKLNENTLDQVDTLIAKGAAESEIVAEIFNDTAACIVGVEEQKEYLFQKGLSTGIAVTDSDNVGTGVRVDFKYKYKFGATAVWSDVNNATPVADGQRVIDAAKTVITHVWIDKRKLEQARKTKEVADLYAVSVGNFGTTKPMPTKNAFVDFLESEWGVTLVVIDRTFEAEKDGEPTTVRAWDESKVIFSSSFVVGNLVWKRVVEDTHRSDAVKYINGEHGALLSKYVTHKPFGEWTDIQARQLPVITNINGINQLDTTIVQS